MRRKNMLFIPSSLFCWGSWLQEVRRDKWETEPNSTLILVRRLHRPSEYFFSHLILTVLSESALMVRFQHPFQFLWLASRVNNFDTNDLNCHSTAPDMQKQHGRIGTEQPTNMLLAVWEVTCFYLTKVLGVFQSGHCSLLHSFSYVP